MAFLDENSRSKLITFAKEILDDTQVLDIVSEKEFYYFIFALKLSRDVEDLSDFDLASRESLGALQILFFDEILSTIENFKVFQEWHLWTICVTYFIQNFPEEISEDISAQLCCEFTFVQEILKDEEWIVLDFLLNPYRKPEEQKAFQAFLGNSASFSSLIAFAYAFPSFFSSVEWGEILKVCSSENISETWSFFLGSLETAKGVQLISVLLPIADRVLHYHPKAVLDLIDYFPDSSLFWTKEQASLFEIVLTHLSSYKKIEIRKKLEDALFCCLNNSESCEVLLLNPELLFRFCCSADSKELFFRGMEFLTDLYLKKNISTNSLFKEYLERMSPMEEKSLLENEETIRNFIFSGRGHLFLRLKLLQKFESFDPKEILLFRDVLFRENSKRKLALFWKMVDRAPLDVHFFEFLDLIPCLELIQGTQKKLQAVENLFDCLFFERDMQFKENWLASKQKQSLEFIALKDPELYLIFCAKYCDQWMGIKERSIVEEMFAIRMKKFLSYEGVYPKSFLEAFFCLFFQGLIDFDTAKMCLSFLEAPLAFDQRFTIEHLKEILSDGKLSNFKRSKISSVFSLELYLFFARVIDGKSLNLEKTKRPKKKTAYESKFVFIKNLLSLRFLGLVKGVDNQLLDRLKEADVSLCRIYEKVFVSFLDDFCLVNSKINSSFSFIFLLDLMIEMPLLYPEEDFYREIFFKYEELLVEKAQIPLKEKERLFVSILFVQSELLEDMDLERKEELSGLLEFFNKLICSNLLSVSVEKTKDLIFWVLKTYPFLLEDKEFAVSIAGLLTEKARSRFLWFLSVIKELSIKGKEEDGLSEESFGLFGAGLFDVFLVNLKKGDFWFVDCYKKNQEEILSLILDDEFLGEFKFSLSHSLVQVLYNLLAQGILTPLDLSDRLDRFFSL